MCDGLATFPLQFSQIFGAPPLFPPTSLALQLFVNFQVAQQKLQWRKLPCVRRALLISMIQGEGSWCYLQTNVIRGAALLCAGKEVYELWLRYKVIMLLSQC